VSVKQQRGPRRPTVLTRLADLPTPVSWDMERREAKERNEAIRRAKKEAPRRPVKPGKLAVATVTWLDPAVVVGGLRVVGICSDASDEVKAMYL
jgi:hypothetical protein